MYLKEGFPRFPLGITKPMTTELRIPNDITDASVFTIPYGCWVSKTGEMSFINYLLKSFFFPTRPVKKLLLNIFPECLQAKIGDKIYCYPCVSNKESIVLTKSPWFNYDLFSWFIYYYYYFFCWILSYFLVRNTN